MSTTIAQVLLQNGYADERHFDECVSELRDLFLELVEQTVHTATQGGRTAEYIEPDELRTKAKSL
jgi:hypothetical protein